MVVIIGSLIFIFFTEIDKSRNIKGRLRKNFHFPLSAISIIAVSILIPLSFLIHAQFFSFAAMLIGVMDIITAYFYFRIYRGLEVAKQKKTILWFMIGIIIMGSINALELFYELLMSSFVFIYSSAIIFGGLLMLYSWQNIPLLSDLEWYNQMDQLLVVNKSSSLVFYEYAFRVKENRTDSDLAGSMFSGMTSLLQELLTKMLRVNEFTSAFRTSDKNVTVIDHEDRQIYFAHGSSVVSILIVDGDSAEYPPRLNEFTSAFERTFKNEIKSFKGGLNVFKPTIGLIIESFSRN